MPNATSLALFASFALVASAAHCTATNESLSAFQSTAIASQLNSNDTHATPTLFASNLALVRGVNQMAISFKIDEHWHLYFNGQNDTGQPPTLKMDLPAGVTISPLQVPPPQRLVQADSILDHIYEENLILPFTLTISEDFKGDSLKLEGTLTWLECADVCKFGKGTVSRTLDIAPPRQKPQPDSSAAEIAAAVKAIPSPAPADLAKIEFHGQSKAERVTITVAKAKGLTFVPDNQCSPIPALLKEGTGKGESLTLTFEDAKPNNKLSGLIQIGSGPESRWYHISKSALNPAGPKSVTTPQAPAAPVAR